MNPMKKLRQMLNQEVNSLAFIPEIRGKMPTDILICIGFDNKHIHTIAPDNEAFGLKAIKGIAEHYGLEIDDIRKK